MLQNIVAIGYRLVLYYWSLVELKSGDIYLNQPDI